MNGPYHYEFIKARKPNQWRVGNAADIVVGDFKTEKEARDFVRKANAEWLIELPDSWRF